MPPSPRLLSKEYFILKNLQPGDFTVWQTLKIDCVPEFYLSSSEQKYDKFAEDASCRPTAAALRRMRDLVLAGAGDHVKTGTG